MKPSPHHDPEQTDGGGNGGAAPESTATDLREILRASGGGPPFGFGTQQKAVGQWARGRGVWLPWEQAAAGATEGGVEHLVRPEPSTGCITKITRPPVFGRVPGLNRLGLPSLLDAAPLEYLERWRLSNELFGDSVRIIAATEMRAGFPSFIISQPWVPGEPPEPGPLREYLRGRGFEKVPDEHVYFDGQIALFDARPANFAFREGVPVAFDVLPIMAEAPLRAMLERLMQGGSAW